jgi:hypothetical protein
MIARSRPRRSANESEAAAIADAPTPVGAGQFISRLVPLDAGFYAISLAADTNWVDPIIGFALPAIQLNTAPDAPAAIEITDSFGRAGSWLGGRHKTLFVKVPEGGSVALATAYLARDPESEPLTVEVRRLAASGVPGWSSDEAVREPVLTLVMGDPAAGQTPRVSAVDIIAHIRGRGDVRFIDAPWAGRLGRDHWIEAFALVPRDRTVSASLEYKGLMADGSETPWLGGGAACGTQGRGIPLLGFAVRQKAGSSELRLDCEYSGYFRSGVTAGPSRNGAPCRSPTDNDPLEGMHVHITQRPRRPAAPAKPA